MIFESLKESLTFVFKEKNWAAKLGFLFFLIFIQTLVVGSFYFFGYEEYNQSTGEIRLSVLFIPSILIVAVTFIVNWIFLIWYQYENTQAGISARETKAFWEVDFIDALKKVVKCFLVSLIVNLPLIFVLLVVMFIGIVIVAIGLSAGPIAILALLLFCGLLLFGFVFAVGYIYFVAMPCTLRLMATNTFSEGLKITENFSLAWKYWYYFLALFLYAIAIGVVIGLPVGMVSIFTDIIFDNDMRYSYLASNLLGMPFTLTGQFLTAYSFAYFSGKLFRDILQKEKIEFVK